MKTTSSPRSRSTRARDPLRLALRGSLAALLALALAACGQVVQPILPDGELTINEPAAPVVGNASTPVTLTGVNIAGDAVVEVGGVAATNVVVTDLLGQPVAAGVNTGTTITFTPPSLTDGTTYDIVIMQGEESVTLEGAFTYQADVDNGTGPDVGAVVLRVNAGGPGFDDWVNDEQFLTGGFGGTFTAQHTILGTDNQQMYESERSTAGQTSISYGIPLANGTYIVRLHFAELYYGSHSEVPPLEQGTRVFNVAAQGQNVLTNFDMFDASGGQSLTAFTEQFTVEVTDGELVLVFSDGVENAKINGIEIFEPADSNDNGNG
jgi:beta-galactosidase